MLWFASATTGNYWNRKYLREMCQCIDGKTIFNPIMVHAGEKNFSCPSVFYLTCPVIQG